MTMREKITRAIHGAVWAHVDDGVSPWDEMDESQREDWLEIADEALDSLMYPTSEMERAGCSTGETDSADGDVCKIFCAMIRVAKTDK